MRTNLEDTRVLRDYQDYLHALQGYITYIPAEQMGHSLRVNQRGRALSNFCQQMGLSGQGNIYKE